MTYQHPIKSVIKSNVRKKIFGFNKEARDVYNNNWSSCWKIQSDVRVQIWYPVNLLIIQQILRKDHDT